MPEEMRYSLFACLEDEGVVLTEKQLDALVQMVEKLIEEAKSED